MSDDTPKQPEILSRILLAAAAAQDSSQAAAVAVESFRERLSEHERRLAGVECECETFRGFVTSIRGLDEEVRGLRSDIRTLNQSMMRNLGDDAGREREIGSLKAEVASVARSAGAKAGAAWGAGASGLVGAVVVIVWLAVWVWSHYHGIAPPQLPR